MKKKTKFFVLFLLIFSYPQMNALSQNTVKAKRQLIYAEKGWQDTGILLKKGQYYSIYARGNWVSGFQVTSVGPDGQGDGTLTNGVLLGWISNKRPEKLGYNSYNKYTISKIIFIGLGGILKSNDDGKLWLGMGDWSECKECAGEIEVLITVYD